MKSLAVRLSLLLCIVSIAASAQTEAPPEYRQIGSVSENQELSCERNGRISGVHRTGVGSAQSFEEPVTFVVQTPHAILAGDDYVRVTANGQTILLRGESASYRMYTLIFECNY